MQAKEGFYGQVGQANEEEIINDNNELQGHEEARRRG
jgi:hypothetical protein